MATHGDSVDLVDGTVVRQFARAAVLAALLGALGPISIPLPFSLAPVTLQVLFVFLAGLVLGPVWGTASMLLYLAAGAVGAPVFAGWEAGLGPLFGQTGGFLWSYPIAAALIGAIVHRGTDLRDPAAVPLPVVVLALAAATVLIYAMGTAYAAWLLELEAWEAIVGFALPFVPGELLKMAAAIAIVNGGRLEPIQA
ncbi:biotin transporter BioY [Natronolimnohabitans innermongolicus]|uniref:BioY protein n=1 Tax=Natronolimnohabitans innermongolicus JCM 12255 TaxID=1227499 RepID=L9WSE3_9EURY|nr:biotin transporter BioY [Natronolimnohabitans innermongolicus]ELY52121.1 BioY protein [Natronolimnohabitans innermongolicus JCM 12255]